MFMTLCCRHFFYNALVNQQRSDTQRLQREWRNVLLTLLVEFMGTNFWGETVVGNTITHHHSNLRKRQLHEHHQVTHFHANQRGWGHIMISNWAAHHNSQLGAWLYTNTCMHEHTHTVPCSIAAFNVAWGCVVPRWFCTSRLRLLESSSHTSNFQNSSPVLEIYPIKWNIQSVLPCKSLCLSVMISQSFHISYRRTAIFV